MLLRRRVRSVPLHDDELRLRCLQCRNRQHDIVRIEAQICHLQRTGVCEDACRRKQLPHGIAHTDRLFHRHLAGCRNCNEQGLNMRNPVQLGLRLLRFALGIRGPGNNVRQLLHISSLRTPCFMQRFLGELTPPMRSFITAEPLTLHSQQHGSHE